MVGWDRLWKGTKCMNKEWFSDYKEQISLNNMQEAINVILDNIDNTQMI